MCNSGSFLHNLQIPPPTAEFLLTSPFFRRTRILPQSSVRVRAGHRPWPCSVKPAKSTRENFPKDSQRVRRRKDYVNKKFRRGPTHPRVAHSCLSTLDYNYRRMYYIADSAEDVQVGCNSEFHAVRTSSTESAMY